MPTHEIVLNPIAVSIVSFAFWFLVFYLYHGLGITVGYHRLLTHKAFQAPRWLMYFIVSGGYLTLMGSPIVWVGVHRLHHQKTDVEGDPHSPRDGFRHALYGWMFDMASVQSTEDLHKQVRDLLADPIMRFLGDDHSPNQAWMCLTICVFFRIAIFLLLGVPALLANLLATFMVFWSPQLVNSVCHLPFVGYRSQKTKDESRNVWWVALLSLGEGWHNNHHAVPTSARHGFKWWEVDISWYAIWLMEKLGLSTNVVRPPGESA